MSFDSYNDGAGELLLQVRQQRFAAAARGRRAYLTDALFALTVTVGAGLLAQLRPDEVRIRPIALLVVAATFLLAARIRFPVGAGWTKPTQLVFVPMLFVLPAALAPAMVIGCLLLDLALEAFPEPPSLRRTLCRVADSAYALGPVAVLMISGQTAFAWSAWPVWVAAFAAQVLLDAASGLARDFLADGVRPSWQIQLAWLWLTDLCLASIALPVAAVATRHVGLVLLEAPLMALLGLFARERQERLDNTLELNTAYRGTALLLGDVVEADDAYTGMHSRDVVELALAVADGLGLDPARRRNVEFGALLHDVGKIRVPKEIINKPGKLDESEWAVMRRHTIEGEAMLARVGGALCEVGRIVRSSHERFDGGGYPDGLTGEAIPVESRIVSTCDSFNAMTTDRPYRPAIDRESAVAELRRCAGSQFDPGIVAVLEAVVSGAELPRYVLGEDEGVRPHRRLRRPRAIPRTRNAHA